VRSRTQVGNSGRKQLLANIMYSPTPSASGGKDMIGNLSADVLAAVLETIPIEFSVVDSDVEENVILSIITYSVNFKVTDGTDPIQGSTVTLTGYDPITTDTEGKVTVTEVLPEENIEYTVDGGTGWDPIDIDNDITWGPEPVVGTGCAAGGPAVCVRPAAGAIWV